TAAKSEVRDIPVSSSRTMTIRRTIKNLELPPQKHRLRTIEAIGAIVAARNRLQNPKVVSEVVLVLGLREISAKACRRTVCHHTRHGPSLPVGLGVGGRGECGEAEQNDEGGLQHWLHWTDPLKTHPAHPPSK